MSNFVNPINFPGDDQYEDIFNTLAHATKIMMDRGRIDDRLVDSRAATAVAESLLTSGWDEEKKEGKDVLMANLAATIRTDLTEYLDAEASGTTENVIRNLIVNIDKYLNNNNNDNGAATGGRRRKSRKYKKSKKTKKSRKTRKSRK
jgi:hypothetical protein